MRVFFLLGAFFGGLGVALGAFGAHGLRDTLDARALGWWQTAVDYQMWHAVALIALSAVRSVRTALPASLIGAGTIVFSASLYAMALTDARWLGAVTPVGGLAMILAFLAFAWSALRG